MIWKAGNNLAWHLTVSNLSSLPKKTEFMIYQIVGWQKYSDEKKEYQNRKAFLRDLRSLF